MFVQPLLLALKCIPQGKYEKNLLIMPVSFYNIEPNLVQRPAPFCFVFVFVLVSDEICFQNFLFHQNIICFDWVMNVFLFCGDVFLLKRVISSHNSCHMHVLTIYVKKGLPFQQDLRWENSADSYLCFQLALHPVSYFFLYQSSLSLYMGFDSISSK